MTLPTLLLLLLVAATIVFGALTYLAWDTHSLDAVRLYGTAFIGLVAVLAAVGLFGLTG